MKANNWLIGNDGSSPRVRGTVDHRGVKYGYDRFIPACAGNSLSTTGPRVPTPVHPRVCGEQGGVLPRVRGMFRREKGLARAGNGPPACTGDVRFIPACAGNSSISARSRAISAVHPHVCGEQTLLQPFYC